MSTKFPITGDARTALVAMCKNMSDIIEDNIDDVVYRAKVYVLDNTICFDLICGDEDGRLFVLPFRYGDASDSLLVQTSAYFLQNNKTGKGMGVLRSMKSGLHCENKPKSMLKLFNGLSALLSKMTHFAKPITTLYFDVSTPRYRDCYASPDSKDPDGGVKLFLVFYGKDAQDEYGFGELRQAAGDEFVDFC